MHPRTRSQNLHFLNFEPEIERIAQRNRHEARRRAEMGDQNAQLGHMGVPNVANQNQGELPPQADPVQEGLPYVGDERTLQDYTMPRVELHQSSIRRPTIVANSFEIRPSIIQMIGTTCIFNGLVNDDLNLHLQKFNEICDTFKYNRIPDEFIKLKLFLFSLGNDARIWLNSQQPNSITTFDQLAQAFLNRYFPPGKAARLRNEILSFQQFENESIYEAWERFKELQKRCLHNGLAKWQTLQAFYQGLTVSTRNLVDAAAGGSSMSKSMDAASDLLEDMALNNSQWGSQRQVPKKTSGVLEVDVLTSVNAQMVALQNQMNKMSAGPSNVQVAQYEGGCEEEVDVEKKSSSHDEVPTTPNDPLPQPQVKAYVPLIPYPQRLKKHKDAHNFNKFLEVFKKLHINIPFAEALAQMPTYVRFLKELLFNKRKLEEFETVALTEECSAILQNKLPPKLKDPGKFTIPCSIGQTEFGKALIDSGASINLIPYSVFQKLGEGEVKPTHVTLQLADRSIKYPRGVMEDVLVKVENLYFPVDFVILEMEEDVEIPLLLGRPFLKTAGALIDVKEDKMTLRVGDEHVVFNMKKAAKRPMEVDRCLKIDLVEPLVE
ncbi:hypothetical protein LWI29_005505 [Acer saccharum]|uniref:Retrotransposon gag domain-containing protein n=1 Tax=Acer saccharum TaxID=4024 RepID=A0AA39SQS1_ACESA|nr:hypothetical protein LWI29_005505 [Acer saccharum]